MSSTRKSTTHHMPRMNSTRSKKRSVVCQRAAFALAVIATTCSVDTSHAFCESFPQHFSHQLNNANFAKTSLIPSLAPDRTHTNYDTLSRSSKRSALFYAPNPHTSKTAPMVAQAFFASHKINRNPTNPKSRNASTSNMPLSNSILIDSDTLPAFPTAHGLLSPETVMRMELTTSRGNRAEAVDYFLETYRKEGPMACLPLLSDQEVLPHLTQAMRDIIA